MADLDESYLKSFDGAVQAGHVELLAEGRYMCNVCEKEYANKSSIKSHLTTNKHSTKLSEILSTQTATQATKPEIRHDTAPQDLDESYLKSFDGAVQAGHVELLAEGRYMCNVCEKEYANKSSIKSHLTTNKHSTKLSEILSTQTATQATKPEIRHDTAPQDLDESYLKSFDGAVQAGHVELLAEGRYMCNVCEKEYANKSSIKSHLTTNKHSTKLSEILSTQTATQATKPEIRHDTAPQDLDESYLKSFDGAVQAGHVELLAEGRYMRNVCEKEYANKSSIKRHLTTNKHSTKLPEVLSTQTATQATKPETRHDSAPQDLDESYHKIFDGAVQAGHVELLAEGRYMCNVCEKEYANKSSIKSHLTTNKHSTKLSEILSTQTATQATKPEIRHDSAPQDLDESYLKSFDGAVQAGHVELLAEGRYMCNLSEILSTQTATQATKPEIRHDSAPQDLDESYLKSFDGAVQAGHVELLAEGRYMCNVCEKEYANKSSIKRHLTTNKHSTKLSEISSTQTATQATKPEIRHNSAPQVTDAEVMARLRIKRQEKKNELEYHTNTQLPPGRVEIFNYIFFHYNTRQRLEDRKGAKMDSTNLKITFNRLGYQVFVHENLTANDTFMELENIRKSCKQKPPQAIFFFFLSHGNQGNEFMSADGVPLNIDKIKDEFTNDLCPELAKKPKIFMTNYCRGDNEECLETDGHVRIPQDLVTIYASRDGIAAYRLPNEGTSFVLSLCKVLEKLRERTELHDLYLLLMDEMKRNKATTPIWEEIGFKKFYLEIPERK
ncbi:zinc finger protein 646-like isoform X2 [Portunus trituberculatus]|uniref:zinc finger protein 646-like isoform X2 n=1 Tax=Portunus trituberculatus TaxID=210409 RepID=UPI001E1CF5D5|nr:zinc finger protein 646-like isoform X2 [Portunus trituberculatus]